MKRIALAGQIITLILFLTRGFFIPPVAATSPIVVINELMWMGSSISSADEWIELRNLTDQPIDLSDWRLTKLSNGQEVTMITVPNGQTIAPAGFFLISNYAAESAQSALNAQPDVVDTSVALSNTNLQIKLYTSTGDLIDTADDGAGQPLAGTYLSGTVWKSMERNSLPGDGLMAESWHSATLSQNFDAQSPEYGTPGLSNSEPNHPPVAVAEAENTALVNENIVFNGTGSSDPDGNELSFQWNFGDGSTANEPTVIHSYAEPGDYNVDLIVSDGEFDSVDSHSVSIEDLTAPPDSPPGVTPAEDIEYSRDIRLSELLPNPKGLDATLEFIELTNIGSKDVDLADWEVCDSSRGYYIQSEDFPTTVIKPGAFFVLPRTITGLALNNASIETVRILQPNETALDEVVYQPPVPEGQSYNRTKSGWVWSTTVTQGGNNIITASKNKTDDDPAIDDNQTSDDSTIKQPDITYDYSDKIWLTELLPNPEGEEAEEEFIEIGNFGPTETNLLGWQLTDQKTYYRFEQTTVLEPGDHLAIYRPDTHIALNNPGDTVFLIDPAENIISGVTYEKAASGASWSRQDQLNDWQWSAVYTPNEPNIIVSLTEEENDSIASAPAANKKAVYEAIVTAPNDIFGIRTAYIMIGNDGVLLTLTKGALPDLAVGDRVSITGVRRESGYEKKISLSMAADIVIIGPGAPPMPIPVTGHDLDKSLLGQLVSVSGIIASKSGQNLILESGGQDVSIYFKRTADVSMKDLKEGENTTITGIAVSDGAAGIRILPRFQSDIYAAAISNEQTQAESNPSLIDASRESNLTGRESPSRALWYLLGLMAVVVIGAGIYSHRKKEISKTP